MGAHHPTHGRIALKRRQEQIRKQKRPKRSRIRQLPAAFEQRVVGEFPHTRIAVSLIFQQIKTSCLLARLFCSGRTASCRLLALGCYAPPCFVHSVLQMDRKRKRKNCAKEKIAFVFRLRNSGKRYGIYNNSLGGMNFWLAYLYITEAVLENVFLCCASERV